MAYPTPSGERLHALDAVRGFALIAGIVFHATVSFLPTPGVPLWIVTDNHPSATLGLVFHMLHIFRMTTFFLIAGFFAHLTFHLPRREGLPSPTAPPSGIAVPLLVGWPILLVPIFIALTIWGAVTMADGHPLPPAPKYPGFPSFPLTHLWFLYVLHLLALCGDPGPSAPPPRGSIGSGRARAAIDRVVSLVASHPAVASSCWRPRPPWRSWRRLTGCPGSACRPRTSLAAQPRRLGRLLQRLRVRAGCCIARPRSWPSGGGCGRRTRRCALGFTARRADDRRHPPSDRAADRDRPAGAAWRSIRWPPGPGPWP